MPKLNRKSRVGLSKRTMTDVDKNAQKECLVIQTRLWPKINDLMNQRGAALEVIEAMRTNHAIQKGVMEEMVMGRSGAKNGNITLLTKFVRALLGKPAL